MSRPVVTVKTLLAQVRQRGEIELPENALITPAAQDWLRGSRTPVRRVEGEVPAMAAGPVYYLVGDASAPQVRTLLPDLERRYSSLRFLPCNGNMAGLMQVVREMCVGLHECNSRRGLAVVRDGAGVSCMANKFAKVRAAILGQPSSLFGLMHEMGINLLILERERLSLAQLRSAIDTFLRGKCRVDPVIAAALAGEGSKTETQAGGCPCGKSCPCRK